MAPKLTWPDINRGYITLSLLPAHLCDPLRKGFWTWSICYCDVNFVGYGLSEKLIDKYRKGIHDCKIDMGKSVFISWNLQGVYSWQGEIITHSGLFLIVFHNFTWNINFLPFSSLLKKLYCTSFGQLQISFFLRYFLMHQNPLAPLILFKIFFLCTKTLQNVCTSQYSL